MTPSLTSAPAPARRFQIDSRFVAPLLISAILLAGHLSFGILEDWKKTALCVAFSIVCEAVVGLAVTRKVPHLASAYVSGISCGILVRSPDWWPYLLAPAISIVSKYVIRWQGRHLWNPSNLAIAVLLFIAPNSVASLSIQWGNNIWPMAIIWVLGSTIIYRLKRFHICATYVLFFFAFAALRATFMPADQSWPVRFWAEAAPITGPMYQLFIFFMITDPKTTTQSRRLQMLVAFLVAAAESAIRFFAPMAGWIHLAAHAPYYALTLMGPASNVIEIMVQRRRSGARSGEVATA
jgi:Na+-transporting NADH:ubiquinone oxidoreductase subunit NqrB